jgi:hypothetical protein
MHGSAANDHAEWRLEHMMLLLAACGKPFVSPMGFVACSGAVLLLTGFGAC